MEIARLVAGAGRVRWEWGGKCFTAQGVVVITAEEGAFEETGDRTQPSETPTGESEA